MSNFHKYQHVERLGHSEVAGITAGQVYVFPKIDGTNASIWNEDGAVGAGSRRRHLSLESDNHGFCAWSLSRENIKDFVRHLPSLRLFGEWLVPHTLKSYRSDAWHNFYVFDVFDQEACRYLHYDVYTKILDRYCIDYIPVTAIVNTGSNDQFYALAESNTYLMQPGAIGEGIVLKNYDFVNQFGRTIWAKIVRSEFKEKNNKEFGPAIIKGADMVEQKIIEDCVTQTLVDKERAKIEAAIADSGMPIQPRLLQTVFHCVVKEELWQQLKKHKNPPINFKLLSRLCTGRTKELAKDLF